MEKKRSIRCSHKMTKENFKMRNLKKHRKSKRNQTNVINFVTYKNNYQSRTITYMNKLQAVLNAPAQKNERNVFRVIYVR